MRRTCLAALFERVLYRYPLCGKNVLGSSLSAFLIEALAA